jgi:hypothetical protein
MFKTQALYTAVLITLFFAGCSTSDINYADRNNIDSARARCVDLAQTSGYQDVKADSVDHNGHAEWKVGLLVRKDGRDRKQKCEYDARTDRVHMED